MGRDYSLAACHYMMLQGETMGIGSCINGFIQSYSIVVEKHVKLPKSHRIYAAIKLG